MATTILVESQSSSIIKCSQCTETCVEKAHIPSTKRGVCGDCVRRFNLVVLTMKEHLVYQTLCYLKHHPRYLAETSNKLKIPHKDVVAIAIKLQRRGLEIGHLPSDEFLIKNAQGVEVQLTPKQYLTLKTVTSEKSLLKDFYVLSASEELGWSRRKVWRHVITLTEKGFDIPSSERRSLNLKAYVLDQLKNTNLPRSTVIKRLARYTEQSINHIREIVAELEQEHGIKLREGALWEDILEFLEQSGQELTTAQIHKHFPTHKLQVIRITVNSLRSRGLVIVRKPGKMIYVKAAANQGRVSA